MGFPFFSDRKCKVVSLRMIETPDDHFDSEYDFGKLTVAQLKLLCQERGIFPNGKKEEIIQRLVLFYQTRDRLLYDEVDLTTNNPNELCQQYDSDNSSDMEENLLIKINDSLNRYLNPIATPHTDIDNSSESSEQILNYTKILMDTKNSTPNNPSPPPSLPPGQGI